jgi:hypothetical protein
MYYKIKKKYIKIRLIYFKKSLSFTFLIIFNTFLDQNQIYI